MPPPRRALAAALALTSAVGFAALEEPSLPPVVAAEDEPTTEAPAAAVTTRRRAADLPISAVTLRDGQILRGRVLQQTGEAVTLQLVSGGELQLLRSNIRSIEAEDRTMVSRTGELWFRDPNRTRYFYSPSAMLLKKGEGYFSQKQLFFSAVAYGVTDHVTVLVGSVLPLWLIGNVNGINVIGAVKAGFSPVENIHLAAGFETLVLPGLASSSALGAGFVFAGITIGGGDAHVTVNAGRPFLFTGGQQSNFGDAIVTVSGNYRVARNVAVITENWLLPSFAVGNISMLNGLGARIFGDRWAVDLGLIRIAPAGLESSVGLIPIPWVDFTYNFG